MTVVTIGIVGITAVLLAVQMKGTRAEYGTYLVMAAGCFIFFYGVSKMERSEEHTSELQSPY